MVFGALRENEVVAANDVFALKLAVNASVALLHSGRIPGDVEMEKIRAVVLEVNAFAGGVCGDQNAQWVKVGRGIEGLFDFVESATAGTTLVCGDAFFGTISVGEGGFELLAQIRLGFCELSKDQDPAAVPVSVGIEEVLANPGDETLFGIGQSGVGLAACLAGDLGHAVKNSGLFLGGLLRTFGALRCAGDGLFDAFGDFFFWAVCAVVIGVGSIDFSEKIRQYFGLTIGRGSKLLHALPVNSQSGVECLDGREEEIGR